ncbi:MAG: hypothetical protein WCI88_07540 [Chloroflexota bacterium]
MNGFMFCQPVERKGQILCAQTGLDVHPLLDPIDLLYGLCITYNTQIGLYVKL